jgi:hypothetical protein
VSNKVDTPASSRDLRLLMQKEDATEPNFLALLQYFGSRYPEAEHLRIFCETSLRFLLGNYLTQHDIDAMREAIEGRPSRYNPKAWEADAQAVLQRDGTTEQIRYKLEGGDLRDLKSVQLTPRDAACAGCATPRSERSHHLEYSDSRLYL